MLAGFAELGYVPDIETDTEKPKTTVKPIMCDASIQTEIEKT